MYPSATSVENERQFNSMNLIKDSGRNRLGPTILNALCRIKRSGYTSQTCPYGEAIKLWQKQKNRRGVGS